MATNRTTEEAAMGQFYGIIHENSARLAAEGPWVISGIRCAPAGSIVRIGTVDGVDLLTTHGGTCACCGQSISNIVDFKHAVTGADRNALGDRMTLGLDCAKTLAHNQTDARMAARIDTAAKAHQRRLAAARKAKAAEAVRVDCEPLAARCDALTDRSEGFAASFAHSLALGIRLRGKRPSPKQIDLLAKLENEAQ